MRIITQKRIDKATDEIIDTIFEHAEFDIDTYGYREYDIMPYINKDEKPAIAKLLYEILIDKKPRKWWKLTNVAIRRTK